MLEDWQKLSFSIVALYKIDHASDISETQSFFGYLVFMIFCFFDFLFAKVLTLANLHVIVIMCSSETCESTKQKGSLR